MSEMTERRPGGEGDLGKEPEHGRLLLRIRPTADGTRAVSARAHTRWVHEEFGILR